MYCPKCHKHYDRGNKFCPECEDSYGGAVRLIEDPQPASGVSMNLSGDANAISMHTSDSHNVHNEDRSVHNTVNNITQAQKTKDELKQEKLKQYLDACRTALADNRLDPSEEAYLRRLSLELDIDEATADRLLNEVKQLANSRLQDTELPRRTRRELDKLADNLDNNDAQAIMQQLYDLEASVANYKNDELQYNYYLVLAGLYHEKCIEKHECSKVDNYWLSFWTYIAYLKANKPANASQVFYSMDKKFPNQPQDNLDLLAAAGSLIKNNKKDAKDDLEDVEGAYSPLLISFAKSIYFLADPKKAQEMGADENTCAFYLVNFFGQKDPKAKAEEERLKREAAEAERKRKEMEEQKRKEEEARRKAEEERRRKEAEAAERKKIETEKKHKAEEAARKKAEEERKKKEEKQQKREKASWKVVCDNCGYSVSNSEPRCPCCGNILKSHATAHSMIICGHCGYPVDSSKKLCPYCASNLNGHEYVDLGLPSGTFWATCNIGASKPEEFGNYFAWGETSGFNEGKRYFDDDHYKFYTKRKGLLGAFMGWFFTKYCDSNKDGNVDYKSNLDKEDDAAHVQWGKGWRIPTKENFIELRNEEYTECSSFTINGIKGLLITSKINGCSIFLPVGGKYGVYEANEKADKKEVCYWSRTLGKENHLAYSLNYTPSISDTPLLLDICRWFGLQIRPVHIKG